MIVNNNINHVVNCVIESKVWNDIGKLIHDITNGSNDGYKLWVMYSKFDFQNFSEYKCLEFWNEMCDEPDDLPEGW